ncbi:MAG: hypothetical protein HQK83_20805, partial [Fibrobacteria bacterium]|nr:hypothetical protein [Fibrobacteria bacterium]
AVTVTVAEKEVTLIFKDKSGTEDDILTVEEGDVTTYFRKKAVSAKLSAASEAGDLEGTWIAFQQKVGDAIRILKEDPDNQIQLVISAKEGSDDFKIEIVTTGKPEYISEEEQKNDSTPVVLVGCGDLTEAQLKTGDSLVALANASGVEELEALFNTMDTDGWDKARTMAPEDAMELYKQALEKAPGHCGAVFGKTIADLVMVIEDQKLDKFVKHVEDLSNQEEPVSSETSPAQKLSAKAIAATPPAQAPGMLAKISKAMNTADPLTVQEIQDLAENVLLPKVENTITSLENILGENDFSFEFTVEPGTPDEEKVQLDQGEIGPMIAAAKVFKAFLIVVIAHDLSASQMDGSMQWAEDMETVMDNVDFDALSAQQKKTLDHLTGLADASSSFTTIKSDWKTKYQAIPDLLLEAIDNLQDGMRYGLTEAKAGVDGQKNDPYIVGDGVEADVTTADFEYAIENLEKAKKYLQTEPVTVKYAGGTKSIKVNLRKIFEMDGYQKYFPYFKFNPYEEWNDIISSDTSWDMGFMWGDAREEIYNQIGFDAEDWNLDLRPVDLSYLFEQPEPPSPEEYEMIGRQYGLDSATVQAIVEGKIIAYSFNLYYQDSSGGFMETAATMLQKTDSCKFSFMKMMNQNQLGEQNYEYTQLDSSEFENGDFTLGTCREADSGIQYVNWIDEMEKGPLYFTDKDGKKTFGPE